MKSNYDIDKKKVADEYLKYKGQKVKAIKAKESEGWKKC